MHPFIQLGLVVWLGIGTSRAQLYGTFRNLNFEGTDLPVLDYGEYGEDVLTSSAIPAWTAYGGGAQDWVVSSIWHNNISLGGPFIAIYGLEWTNHVLNGRFSMGLGTPPIPTPYFRVGLGQVGQIPPNAKSLLFSARVPLTSSQEPVLKVTFAGSLLKICLLQKRDRYFVLGADVSRFAGQTGELRFTAGSDEITVASLYLDDIRFSEILGEPRLLGERTSVGKVKVLRPLWSTDFDVEKSEFPYDLWTKVTGEPVEEGLFLVLLVDPSEVPTLYRMRRR